MKKYLLLYCSEAALSGICVSEVLEFVTMPGM
jgi:hypothetical protein